MKALVLALFGCAVLVWAARPALAFKFGYLPGSPEEQLRKDWLRDRYHEPSDDLNQPVDLAVRAADAAGRPRWKPNSFFRRSATT
jgi:hypothetical protein